METTPTTSTGGEGITVAVIDPDIIIRRTILEYLQPASDITFVDGGPQFTGLEDVGVPAVDVVLAGCHLLDDAPPDRGWRVVGMGPRTEAAAVLRKGGLAGFIATESDPEQFRAGVRAAGSGLFVTSPCVAHLVVGGARHDAVLTERERSVLLHLQQGASNREIAEALFVSVSTVKATVSGLLRKLGVRTRAAAAALAPRVTPVG